METHYRKIYSGNSIVVQYIKQKMEDVDIVPILKHDSHRGLNAMLVSDYQEYIEVYVHEDELDKANATLHTALEELEIAK